MNPVSESLEELLPRLAELRSDEERDRFFSRHPEMVSEQMVRQICDHLRPWMRRDMAAAGRLVSAASWLTERLDDSYCRARTLRARANLLHRSGDYRTAMQLYEEALALFDRIDEQLECALTRSSALQNLNYLGQYDRAFEWAAAAQEVFERHGDRLRLARLEIGYGSILFRQDRWEEAILRYRWAYENLVEIGEPLDIAVCLRDIAVCEICLNRFDNALDAYRDARDFCKTHGMEVLALENDYNIAYLYYLRGEYTRAIQLYQQARRDCERLDNKEHLALCDLDQAEIFLELNLVEEAAQLGQSAFDNFDRLGMKYEAAKGLTILAIAVSRQGKEFLALDLLEKARRIFVDERNQVWPAQIDLYRALVLYGEGRQIEAEALCKKALTIFNRSSFPTKSALCEILLARLQLERGEAEAARNRCLEALEILRPIGVPALEYQAYFVLGQVEEALDNRPGALEAYQESHGMLERLRSHLQTDELKITFLEDKLVVYENLVALKLHPEATFEEKHAAFTYVEKAKSRSLADLMAFRAHALPAKTGTRSKLVDQIRNLREELNWYYRQIDLRQIRADEHSRAQLLKLRRESHQREEQLLRTMRELQTTDQELSSLQDATTVPLDAIRSVMPDDTLLVEYYISQGVVYGGVIGRNHLDIFPLTVVSRVQEQFRLLQFQLSKFLLGIDYVAEFRGLVEESTQSHLQELYDELVAPLRPRLEADHLVMVPHDFLHHVPFHALYDGERYLSDSYSLSYSPSASVYYLCRIKKTHSEDSSLVLGISDERAPHIRDEVRAVSEALPNSRLLIDEEADEEALRVHAERCRILHIATHGVFRQDNPMFSAIQLGKSRLSLFDLYGLKLNADLVVLSGCGTGLNVALGADELVGLSRGLLYAGAQSVLVTLWDVNDRSTADFMRSFYRQLSAVPKPARALQLAMRETREQYPDPYYWAPFVLIGRPEGR